MYKPLLFLMFCSYSWARGRYEYIEEADLPAFYSMRSAQMAQKAQLPSAQLIQDYNPYVQYQFYQPPPAVPEFQTTGLAYSPFAVYSPVYRHPGQPAFGAPRVAPVQYSPLAYFQSGSHNGAMMPQPNSSAIRKKTAKT